MPLPSAAPGLMAADDGLEELGRQAVDGLLRSHVACAGLVADMSDDEVDDFAVAAVARARAERKVKAR